MRLIAAMLGILAFAAAAAAQAAGDAAASRDTPAADTLAAQDTAAASDTVAAPEPGAAPGAAGSPDTAASDTAAARDTVRTPEAAAAPDTAAPNDTMAAAQNRVPRADTAAAAAMPAPPVFREPALLVQEYLFGMLGGAVFGAIGFYSGKGIESLVREGDFRQGRLGFTGVRYTNFDGGFWGGATGLALGTGLGTYFTGQLDEDDGSILWTWAGSALFTAGALWLADLAGVEEEFGWRPFVPLLGLPPVGAVVGFNVSRWLREQRRREITGEGREGALRLGPPALGLVRHPGGLGWSLRAVNVRF